MEGSEVYENPDRVVVDKDGVSIYKGSRMVHFEIQQHERFDGEMYWAELDKEPATMLESLQLLMDKLESKRRFG